jgi:hypothetical protein
LPLTSLPFIISLKLDEGVKLIGGADIRGMSSCARLHIGGADNDR